jgi:hypothetical protein
MKGGTSGADLCEEVKKRLQSLVIPVQKVVELVMDGVPCRLGGTVVYLCLSQCCEEYNKS